MQMPGASCHLPAENELAMPQYIIKLTTYDPATIGVFEQLRTSRKFAAFTNEALKYFLKSERGAQVVNLMLNQQKRKPLGSVMSTDANFVVDEISNPVPDLPSGLVQDGVYSVIKSILK